MPTPREREYYQLGFQDGIKWLQSTGADVTPDILPHVGSYSGKGKRKLSAWQKFVKVNSKKPRFRYKSGSNRGKINLKALGVAYRKKRR